MTAFSAGKCNGIWLLSNAVVYSKSARKQSESGFRKENYPILFAQHTDYIFSAVGEELGFLGCLAIILMELAIISRCIYVGIRCHDYMRRLVCFGAASSLMFQVLINVGMCIGVMPVIGLTMPLISYGGSSVVIILAMLGLVSGAYARPQSLSYERYIQPYRGCVRVRLQKYAGDASLPAWHGSLP